MALPILEAATYELTLPSQDVKIKFRAFLVKEEKVLLQALESEETKQIVEALKQIVHTCTFGSINVDELPTFDLEYIFLQIRSKSVGEIAKIRVRCPDDNETFVTKEIDLTKVEVEVDDKHTNNIVIDEAKKLGIIMKYPTINAVDPTANLKGMRTKQLFEIIGKSIYQVYEGDKTHNAVDYKPEELNQFIESLDSKAFGKIQSFFATMPKLTHEIEVENPKTKVKSKVVLNGLSDFFVSPSHTIT